MITNEEFIVKLNMAIKMGLEFFEQPKQKPNLSRDQFLDVIKFLNADSMTLKIDFRKTKKGKNSVKAENNIFHLNFEVRIFMRNKAYYVKGYFFDEDILRGVFVHSFREG